MWLCACVCGRGWCVLARQRSHFPSRLNIMQIHTHTHTPRKRWNIITVRAAVSRPLTQAALCSNTDAHTHTHSLQTQTQAFHIGNIITAITSDSNITLHLGLSLSLSRCVSASYSISPLFLLTLPFLLLSTHVGIVYNHLCVCLCE